MPKTTIDNDIEITIHHAKVKVSVDEDLYDADEIEEI